MLRILVDTNVFVASAYNEGSASAKIVNAVRQKKFQLVVSPAIMQEYEAVLSRAIRSDVARERVWQTLEAAENVVPEQNPPVTEDRSDDKFLAAAVASEASAIVTSDQHLLAVHPYQAIDILKPTVFWNSLPEDVKKNDDR
jgi:putative PIN family toxin of toxin-antitoxin system